MAFTNASIEELRNWAETEFPAGPIWGGKYENQQRTKWLIRSPWRKDVHPSYVLDLEKTHAYDRTEPVGETMPFSNLAARLGLPEPGGPLREKGTSPQVWPEETSAQARIMWMESLVAVEHAYLTKKGIATREARVTVKDYRHKNHTTKKGTLLIPARGLDARLQGVECISPEGNKLHLGKKIGMFSGDAPEPGKVLYLAEGFATAHAIRQLTGKPAAEVFGLPCFKTFAEAAKKKYPTCELVFCPDHIDNEQQRKQAEDLKAFGPVVLIPQERREKYDWWDELNENGIDAARGSFQKALEASGVEQDAAGAEEEDLFPLLHPSEMEDKDPEFLIEDILERDKVILIFGDSGAGKSFVVFDMLLSIATGGKYHGKYTEKASCYYFGGEGGSGIARRVAAWSAGRGVEVEPEDRIFFSTLAPMLPDEKEEDRLVRTISNKMRQVGERPAVFCIDTLNSCMNGSENDASDMGAFIRAINRVRGKFPGCSAILVHHSGLSEKNRARGSSALKAALDMEIRIDGAADQENIQMVCLKNKDGELFPPMFFRKNRVVLREDKRGREVASLCLSSTDGGPVREKKGLTPTAQFALDNFLEAARLYGYLDESGKFAGLPLETWRPHFYKKSTKDKEDTKRKAFNTGRDALVTSGRLTVNSDVYFPAGDTESLFNVLCLKEIKKLDFVKDDSGKNREKSGNVPAVPGGEREKAGNPPIGVPAFPLRNLTDSTIPEGQDITKKEKGPSPLRGEKKALADAERASAEKWYQEQPEEWRSALEVKAREDWSPIMARSPEDAIQAAILTSYKLAHEKPVKKPYSELLAEGGADDAAAV